MNTLCTCTTAPWSSLCVLSMFNRVFFFFRVMSCVSGVYGLCAGHIVSSTYRLNFYITFLLLPSRSSFFQCISPLSPFISTLHVLVRLYSNVSSLVPKESIFFAFVHHLFPRFAHYVLCSLVFIFSKLYEHCLHIVPIYP